MTDLTSSSSSNDNINMERLPILPLRDLVLYPEMVAPLFVGRDKSITALEEVIVTPEKHILLVTQRNPSLESPGKKDLYDFGVVARILQMLKLPDGTIKVLVEGIKRAEIIHVMEEERCIYGLVTYANDSAISAGDDVTPENENESLEQKQQALMRTAVERFREYAKLSKKISPEIVDPIGQITDPSKCCDAIAMHMLAKIELKQELLEAFDPTKRLERLLVILESEISLLDTERRIRTRVKSQMEKSQKEFYLNEQLKAIHKELGGSGDDDEVNEVRQLEENVKAAKMTKEAEKKALAEIKKLRMMNPMAAEATVIRNYIDWMLALPWNKKSRVSRDIVKAEKVLERDHYGLEKVKERIVEYLAVQQRTNRIRGPILCLVGPPGVGKTSLARSIAEATNRNYVRMSLGGVRDEAEIRGHRRTYIGSMPGKVIQNMRKAKTQNPLFLLDEIDKMGLDYRGDPASALLEVLDPEQNSTFQDHYMEVDYDLSHVMFVATANSMDLPRPLLDRMEIIRIPGYTEEEKLHIATRHLIPKQLKEHGVKKKELTISESALRDMVRYYTREAGVRNLEREIAKLARKSLKQLLTKKSKKSVQITSRNLAQYLGVRKFSYGMVEKENLIGVTTGLAYTEVGGDLLLIETARVPGKGNTTITGKLGDVMKESVQAAFSFVKSRSGQFGISPKELEKHDVHVHVPEGATPKDGPSAGIAICTSIVSLLTHIPVRREVAMTGEITLRGRVLPIGGLKEKLLAALRGGITTVLIPSENEKDLTEIPANVKKGLNIIPVSDVTEVLSHALEYMPEPIDWIDVPSKADTTAGEDQADNDRLHH